MSRRILILSHTGRVEARQAACLVIEKLHEADIIPVLLCHELEDLQCHHVQAKYPKIEIFAPENLILLELIIVLGGDGTILRGAELGRNAEIPLLGVNLGHVGFLAESEKEFLQETAERIISKEYAVEDRMTLGVRVFRHQKLIHQDWALNEAALEKNSETRMIEVAIEVDKRPLLTYGCDGVVISTPTGSTAYAFSAGGPVIWPEVEAILMVPLSAHTLFARPLIVNPKSQFAVELLHRNEGDAILWCDGRRTFQLKAGDRVEASISEGEVHLVRLKALPFTSRLVQKFNLPVNGWRGPDEVRAHD